MKISNVWNLVNSNNLRMRFLDSSSISEKLSSGLKINKAADDPSGLGISTNYRSAIGGINQAIANIQDGLKLLNTMDASLNEVQDLLMRGRDLAVRAASGALWTSEDLDRMQAEVDGLLGAIDEIAYSTKYNGKALISGGSGPAFDQTTQADWQAGTYNADEIDLVTTPGDVKLQPEAWDTQATFNTRYGGSNEYFFNIFLSSYSDNGDGTVDVTLNLDACKQGAGTINYKGFVYLDAGITNVTVTNGAGTNVVYTGGGVFDFNSAGRQIQAGSAGNTTECQVTYTVDKDAAMWQVELAGGPGQQVEFFHGDVSTRKMLLSYTETGYFTDMTQNATFQSSAVDTGQEGGTATFTWNATTGGGTNIVMQLFEASAAGGPWTPLGLFENGDTFEYNSRYLAVQAVLTSSGIAYGTPTLEDFQIQLKQGGTLQIGGDNNVDIYQKTIQPVDARAAGLGISNIDITALNKAIKVYDTASEWQSGIVSSTNIDNLSSPGNVLLEAPLISKIGVQQNGFPRCYINVESAVARPDGKYDVVMSVNMYGLDPDGAGPDDAFNWLGSFSASDGNGAITFDQAWTIDGDSGTPAGIPLGENAGTYRDGTAADGVMLNNDGTVAAGAFSTIQFDYSTGGAKDGFGVKFTCSPDAVFSLVFNNEGLDAQGAGGNRTHSGNYYTADVYFGSDLVADDVGAGAGYFTLNRRLEEYLPNGSFTTGGVYFGASSSGMLSGVTNAGNTLFEVQESEDGIGGWTTILANGAGNDFTTSSSGNYVRVVATMNGTSEVWNANPYSYSQSSSPVISAMTIEKNISPITEFNNAINDVSDIRAEIGILEKELQHALETLNDQRINLTAANSRILDANYAKQFVDYTKSDILTQSVYAVIAQGDAVAEGVLDLINDQGINPGLKTAGELAPTET
ncbi:MAG TPA: flagellin [bacterium]|nr:flagellin [bacterium]